MAIDYKRQFKSLTDADFDAMNTDAQWPKRREYQTARQAFRSAQRTENLGIGVAFAEHNGTYYVWVEKPTPVNACPRTTRTH